MTISSRNERYAYISCPRIQLRITDPSSPHFGAELTLLARRGATLLVEQEAIPNLIEITAESTNVADFEPLPSAEERKLVPQRLQEALRLIQANRDAEVDPDDVSDLRWVGTDRVEE